MASLSSFLDKGDFENIVVYDDSKWRIVRRRNKGYESWYTLHKKKKIFRFEWWGGLYKWGRYGELLAFVERWNDDDIKESS